LGHLRGKLIQGTLVVRVILLQAVGGVGHDVIVNKYGGRGTRGVAQVPAGVLVYPPGLGYGLTLVCGARCGQGGSDAVLCPTEASLEGWGERLEAGGGRGVLGGRSHDGWAGLL